MSEWAPTLRSLWTVEEHPGSTHYMLIAHLPLRCDDQTCLHTQPSVPGGEGPIALVKNHCCCSAGQELILNCSESPDPALATNSVTQSVCQVQTAQHPSNLGHLQCIATETLCCLRPHVTYQSVSPKTCCLPPPCH